MCVTNSTREPGSYDGIMPSRLHLKRAIGTGCKKSKGNGKNKPRDQEQTSKTRQRSCRGGPSNEVIESRGKRIGDPFDFY